MLYVRAFQVRHLDELPASPAQSVKSDSLATLFGLVRRIKSVMFQGLRESEGVPPFSQLVKRIDRSTAVMSLVKVPREM